MTQIEPAMVEGQLAKARERLRDVGGPFGDHADASFDNEPGHVADWIQGAVGRALAGDYVEFGRPSPPADRIYVEMNRFEINPDRWFMDAFPCAPPPDPDAPVNIDPVFDARVGYYIDTTVAEPLELTGMQEMQRHFAIHRTGWTESARAAEDVVRWSWFALLDHAWRFSAIKVPVAAAVHDEMEFLVFGTST